MSEISGLTKSTGQNIGIDGEATNIRHRANMFAPEVIMTEKEKLRKLVKDNSASVKEVYYDWSCKNSSQCFIIFYIFQANKTDDSDRFIHSI